MCIKTPINARLKINRAINAIKEINCLTALNYISILYRFRDSMLNNAVPLNSAGVRGHSSKCTMAPFDRLYTTSYWSVTVTIARIVFELFDAVSRAAPSSLARHRQQSLEKTQLISIRLETLVHLLTLTERSWPPFVYVSIQKIWLLTVWLAIGLYGAILILQFSDVARISGAWEQTSITIRYDTIVCI